jgi:two-component system nitrogen regulation response regulator GlnG
LVGRHESALSPRTARKREHGEFSAAVPVRFWVNELVGVSAVMGELMRAIERVAATDVTVLIEGETGSGKELVAEAIHARSARVSGPYVVCDLGALNPALLESELFGHKRGAFTSAERERQGAFLAAQGGTLFLDEVGELDALAQPRLLRAIERKQIKPVGSELYQEVDVRIVAATNRDLQADVAAGRFRSDLYHRLSVVHIRVPPLRERREDIPGLVAHFLRAALPPASPLPRVHEGAMRALCAYDWPGNVRELRNVIERALSFTGTAPALRGGASLAGEVQTIELDALGLQASPSTPPPAAGSDLPAGEVARFKDAKDRAVENWEREYLVDLLSGAGGNVSLAARRSGMARGHLHRLLRKHGLTR